MKSGSPDPSFELKLIMEQKCAVTADSCEIVSNAAKWLKSELDGAAIVYQYGACDCDVHSGYAVFIIVRKNEDARIVLELKIAEIDGTAYIFADVRSLGRHNSSLFPYFGEIGSEEGRRHVLHFIADYLLGTKSA